MIQRRTTLSEGGTRVAVWLTMFCGLVLSIVPLVHWLAILRPAFLAMVIAYWGLMVPRGGAMLLGFVGGLMLDVFDGSLLGEHALALGLIAYLAIRFSLLLRAMPLFQQSLYVLAGLMCYETLLWAIDGWSGHALSTPLRWIPALTGSLCWPVLVGVFGRLHAQS